jgi:hypothetical protein
MALKETWYIYEKEKMLTGSDAFCMTNPTDLDYGYRVSVFSSCGYNTREEALAELERVLRAIEYYKYSSYFVLPQYSLED